MEILFVVLKLFDRLPEKKVELKYFEFEHVVS